MSNAPLRYVSNVQLKLHSIRCATDLAPPCLSLRSCQVSAFLPVLPLLFATLSTPAPEITYGTSQLLLAIPSFDLAANNHIADPQHLTLDTRRSPRSIPEPGRSCLLLLPSPATLDPTLHPLVTRYRRPYTFHRLVILRLPSRPEYRPASPPRTSSTSVVPPLASNHSRISSLSPQKPGH